MSNNKSLGTVATSLRLHTSEFLPFSGALRRPLAFNPTPNVTTPTTSPNPVEMIEIINPSILIDRLLIIDQFDINLPLAISLGIILGAMILFTVIGNLFVIIAIVTERHLRRPQNYLIVSLAVADMTVGLAVMPLSAMYEITQRRWLFGAVLCEAWIFADVTACSASILHLVAIAVDRYLSITNVHYSQERKASRTFTMIAVTWIISLLISILPIVGWKDHAYQDRIRNQICLISQEPSFQVFSTTTAFYAPLVLIITLYGCIWKAAKDRIRRRTRPGSCSVSCSMESSYSPSSLRSAAINNGMLNNSMLSLQSQQQTQSPAVVHRQLTVESSNNLTSTTVTVTSINKTINGSSSFVSNGGAYFAPNLNLENLVDESSKLVLAKNNTAKAARQKRTIEMKRERKAFHTLAIITGTFIVCWLPFFVGALFRPVFGIDIPLILDAIFQWLGWSNSLLNPVIYTVFAPDFRNAFRKILLKICPCGCRLG